MNTDPKSTGVSYASPSSLVADSTLSREDKIAFLNDWRQRVQDRLDSASEGMLPESTAAEVKGDALDPVSADAELMRSIDLELERLQAKSA